MALPTFYRFRCLRKEPHDERLVVVVNCAVWMVLRDFTVFINMRILGSNQSSCNLTPFTADLKFFAPQQITLSHDNRLDKGRTDLHKRVHLDIYFGIPLFYFMKVECLQGEMRSLDRKTTLPSIMLTLILQHLVRKINNDSKLTNFLILYKIIFFMESYKSSTTWMKMNRVMNCCPFNAHYCLKNTTGRHAREPRSEKLKNLKNCVWSFPKIATGNLFQQNTLKRAFRSNAVHRKHSLLHWRKSLLITHSLTQTPSTLMRGFIQQEKRNRKLAFSSWIK